MKQKKISNLQFESERYTDYCKLMNDFLVIIRDTLTSKTLRKPCGSSTDAWREGYAHPEHSISFTPG